LKHRWYFIPLKIAMIATLLFSLGGVITSQTAFASTCNNPGGGEINLCLITGGAGVSVVRPGLGCYDGTGGANNILQGCSGSNEAKRGLANYNGVQQWVDRYGWTYSGTGDGKRYFVFSNYAYFTPMDYSQRAVSYSDGNEYKNTCYPNHICDYQAWQNYINDYHSPTAQLRDWVALGRNTGALAEVPLAAPQPGIVSCQGKQVGQITQTISGGIGVTGNGGGGGLTGNIGFTTGQTVPYYSNGECQAGGVDQWSLYMNLNWGGDAPCGLGEICPNTTESAQSYINATTFIAPNGSNFSQFDQGWNLDVNWWTFSCACIVDYNLFGGTGGPNNTYNYDVWSY